MPSLPAMVPPGVVGVVQVGWCKGARVAGEARGHVDAAQGRLDLVVGVAGRRPGDLDGLLEVQHQLGDPHHALVDLGLLGVEGAGADALPAAFEAVDDALEGRQLALDVIELAGELVLEILETLIANLQD